MVLFRPSTPWDEPQALQTRPAQGPLSPRATAFSRNHKTTRGGSQVQETHVTGAQPELCDSLPKNNYNWGSRCLWGEAKNILLWDSISLASASRRHTALISALCLPHMCSAVATHTLCSPTCFVPLIPRYTSHSQKAGVHSVTITSYPQSTYLGQRASLHGC